MENNEQDLAWRAAYNALCEFARVYNRIPKRNEAIGALRLGAWVHNQRQAQRRKRLSAERAALLDRVPGWAWVRDPDAAWRAVYDELREFVRAHGRLPKVVESGGGGGDLPRLGVWMHHQRTTQRSGRLADERAALLEELPGWTWVQDSDAAWRAMYDALCEFVRARDRLPKQYETVGSPPLRLGSWACYQRQARRWGRLPAERAALLDRVPGWYWKFDADAVWRAAYGELCEFARARGRLPKKNESVGDLRLGSWACDQRTARRWGRLDAERVALLDQVPGWRWAAEAVEAAEAADEITTEAADEITMEAADEITTEATEEATEEIMTDAVEETEDAVEETEDAVEETAEAVEAAAKRLCH